MEHQEESAREEGQETTHDPGTAETPEAPGTSP